MSENFSKYLSQVKPPKIKSLEHKRKLKNALLKGAYLKDKKQIRSSLFDDLKNMSLKKLIPASVLAIFVFTLVGQSFMSWRNTAYAQELIHESIEKIESQFSNKEKEVLSTIKILEAMKDAGELEYLGEYYPSETKGKPEKKIQQFSFNDKDFITDLIIEVINNKELNLYPHTGLGKLMYENYEVGLDADQDILDKEALINKLKDPNIKKPWVITLIKRANLKWLNDKKELAEKRKNTLKVESLEQKEELLKTEQALEKAMKELEPFILNAEVLIGGAGLASTGHNNAEFTINLYFLKISGQKIKNKDNQEKIQSWIDQLSKFKTHDSQKKIDILQKAMVSENFKDYPGTRGLLYSFPYSESGTREELTIQIDPEKKDENFISFKFRPQNIDFFSNKKVEWIDVKIKNDEIINKEELKKKFFDPYLKDETLSYIIKAQNQAELDLIREYEINQQDELGPLIFIEYDKQGDSESKLKLFNEFQEIVKEANVPIIDRSVVPSQIQSNPGEHIIFEDRDPNILYSLGIYTLGEPPAMNNVASKQLDGIIEDLKASVNSDNASTIEILKHALEAKDLKYEGTDEDGVTLSFSDPSIPSDIRLVLKEDAQVTFSFDTPDYKEIQEREEKLEIKIDKNNKVTNLAEIESKLKDPNLKTQWIKELVKMNNYSWLQGLGKIQEYTLNLEGLSEEEKIIALEDDKRNKALDAKCAVTERAVAMQLKNIIKNSTVSIQGSEIGCGGEELTFELYLFLYPLTRSTNL